ncbi:MAG: exopolysaccharide biosynthesis polyprenyl glycosylphosphotransferase [Streptosporangiales bacterium]|nr:exopolysaccharide biosynthesis polyprenyl glycosylphosphotransferase [Streptosporangiales bacterium]
MELSRGREEPCVSVVDNTAEAAAAERTEPTAAVQNVQRWQHDYQRRIGYTDLVAGAVIAALAFWARFGDMSEYGAVPYLISTVLLPFCWVLLLAAVRAYEPRFLFVGTEEFRRVVVAGGTLLVFIALISYAGKFEVARGWVLLTVPPLTVGTLLVRYAWRKHLHRRRARRGQYMHRTIVVGYQRATANLYRTLQNNHYHGLRVVGACLPPAGLAASDGIIADCGIPILGAFDDVPAAVSRSGADVVVVLGCPELDGPAMRRLAWGLEESGTDLLVAPVLLEVAGPRVSVRPVADLPLMHVEHIELTRWRWVLKSAFDRLGAALLLVLAAPLMLAIAGAVKLTDGGPVVFRQERVGLRGGRFEMYKFRSMRVDAEDMLDDLLTSSDSGSVLFKMRADPRVTKVGRLLRRLSLDELPQLVNVLRGEMSLVGPRPPLPREVEQYEWEVHRRFAVRPGITGLWQVSGRSDLEWNEAVRLDIRYVEQWSLLLDILIICRTVGAVLRRSGAY